MENTPLLQVRSSGDVLLCNPSHKNAADSTQVVTTGCEVISIGSGPPILAIYRRPAYALYYQYFRLSSIVCANPPESLLTLL